MLLRSYTRTYGPSLAALEIALWDIIGKACSQPIWKLLGGWQDRLPIYASTGENISTSTIPKVAKMCSEGIKAVKVRFHDQDPMEDLDALRNMRDTLGDKVTIMVDANQALPFEEPFWTFETALRVARSLEELNVCFLEEPLNKDNLTGYTKLAEETNIPIAGGEGEWEAPKFDQYMKENCFDIIQPDVVLTGFYNAKKIAVLSELRHKLCIPHTWSGGGIGLAANLQFAGSIPNCPYLEYPYDPPGWTLEARDFLLEDVIKTENGTIRVLDKPGLGVSIDLEKVEQYTIEKVN